MDKSNLGKNIKAARKALALTGEQLAERCNINATYLRQIESGLKIPSLPLFIVLCQELKVSPSVLLSETGTDTTPDDTELYSIWQQATPAQKSLIKDFSRLIIERIPL